ncbi:hypothetical protein [Actinoplanes sp. NPDC023714]|uniref:hypothetical protein n=1 Tax=Actinoplanes sp. NPDC023714 TaxID=3154322 RepID=UPI0033E4449C
MKRILGTIIALYFVVRAVAEPFLIDMSDPSTYQADWGGPSLAGVLLVHCGPGVVAAILLGFAFRRWWGRRLAAEADRAWPYRGAGEHSRRSRADRRPASDREAGHQRADGRRHHDARPGGDAQPP